MGIFESRIIHSGFLFQFVRQVTSVAISHTRQPKVPYPLGTFPCVMTSLQHSILFYFACNLNTCPFRTFVRESSSLVKTRGIILLDSSLPTPPFNMSFYDREVVFPSIGYVDNLANNLRDVPGVLMAKARPNGACRRCMFLEQTSANFARKQCNYKFIHDTSRKRERNVRVRKLHHPQPSRTKTRTHRTCHASSTNLSPGWAPRCTSRSTPIVGLRVALRP